MVKPLQYKSEDYSSDPGKSECGSPPVTPQRKDRDSPEQAASWVRPNGEL